MSIIVYWTDPGTNIPGSQTFNETDLAKALKFCEHQRGACMRNVCISSELKISVGKPGVAEVLGGKTPDGYAYDWTKQHRGRR
jgi:hypothetical protein